MSDDVDEWGDPYPNIVRSGKPDAKYYRQDQLDEVRQEGFQAGLKRGAEIAADTMNDFESGPDVYEAGGRVGCRRVEKAILRELSKDCSPSSSPED